MNSRTIHTSTEHSEYSESLQRILLARPRGFCAGVKRAVETVEVALRSIPPPVFVYHEIVHNTHVVRDLGHRGARFVEDIKEVPAGSVLIFSAHGVSPHVRQQAAKRGLRVIDATCPLVTKVHLEAKRYAMQGMTIFLVGHEGHDEVVGTMGEAPDHIRLVISVAEVERVQVVNPERVAVLTQTTLSLDETQEIMEAIIRRFPKALTPNQQDICYATTNRQRAVKAIAPQTTLILVIGSGNSSNSRRLAEVAQALGSHAYLIDDVQAIDPRWLEGVETLGITAGASAPEHLVRDALKHFQKLGIREIHQITTVNDEKVRFGLPSELNDLHP